MSKEQEEFLNNLDEKHITRDIWLSINELYGKIGHLVNFKYELLIYKIVKGRHIKVKTLKQITGLSRQRLHQIVAGFEQREVERQNDG